MEHTLDNASGMTTVYTKGDDFLSWPKSFELDESEFEVNGPLGRFDGNNNKNNGDPNLFTRAVNNNLFGESAKIRNVNLDRHPSKLVLEIEHEVENSKIKKFGAAIARH